MLHTQAIGSLGKGVRPTVGRALGDHPVILGVEQDPTGILGFRTDTDLSGGDVLPSLFVCGWGDCEESQAGRGGPEQEAHSPPEPGSATTRTDLQTFPREFVDQACRLSSPGIGEFLRGGRGQPTFDMASQLLGLAADSAAACGVRQSQQGANCLVHPTPPGICHGEKLPVRVATH
jgi:hypothetical protein